MKEINYLYGLKTKSDRCNAVETRQSDIHCGRSWKRQRNAMRDDCGKVRLYAFVEWRLASRRGEIGFGARQGA